MRIALVISMSSLSTMRPAAGSAIPPMGLLSLATLIHRHHEVRIFDGQLHHGSAKTFAQAVAIWKPDVIGFSVNFSTLSQPTLVMSRELRLLVPDAIQVFGGNHATFNLDMYIGSGNADFVVLNEGEASFPALLDLLSGASGHLPTGIALPLAQGGYTLTGPASYIGNLDDLPWPDYEILDDPTAYAKNVVSSRGCPYSCVYCSTKKMWGSWRARSDDSVVSEMLKIHDRYGDTEILVVDDTFLVNRARALQMCDRLSALGSPIHWGFSTRIETLRLADISKLSSGGVRWIFLGVESGSDRVLRSMGRKYTRDDVLSVVDACSERGIKCTTSFIVGLPWEQEEDVRLTFELMERVSTDRVLVNLFTVLPGTSAYEMPEALGIRLLPSGDLGQGVVGHGKAGLATMYLSDERIQELWIEGQGIALRKYREGLLPGGRARYGLLGDLARYDSSRN